MIRKKPASPTNLSSAEPGTAACRCCEALERRYQDTISRIREVLETRFQSVEEKIYELRKWQEMRDDAIEVFYSHRRRHRGPIRGEQPIAAA